MSEAKKFVIFDLDETLIDSGTPERKALEETIKQVLRPKDDTLPARLGKRIMELAAERWAASSFYARAKGNADAIGISAHEVLWGDPMAGVEARDLPDSVHQYFTELQAFLPKWRKGVWTQACEDLGVKLIGWNLEEMMSTFVSKRKEKLVLFEGVKEAITALKAEGFRVALLTNGAPGIQREKIRKALAGILDQFDVMVVSGEFGRGKPCPEIFEHVLQKLGVEVKTGFVCMVGDGKADMQGARNYNEKHGLSAGKDGFMDSFWICSDWEQEPPTEWDVCPTQVISEVGLLPEILKAHLGL